MSKSNPVERRGADSLEREGRMDLEVRLPASRNILRHLDIVSPKFPEEKGRGQVVPDASLLSL